MFTKQEVEFLKGVVKQLTINPSAPEAGAVVSVVQSVLSKLDKVQYEGDKPSDKRPRRDD